MKKWFKIFKKAVILCVLICLCVPSGLQANQNKLLEAKDLYAKAFCLMDGDTGRLLFADSQNEELANASTTKILTCILALECADLSDVVTISANASNQPKVRLEMQKGEKYYLNDLLYAMMLESYNDCAVAIAEYVGGSVEKFAQRMNEKTVEIGCKNSCFFTPNGLDFQNDANFHHTTAEDLCKIMRYCCWQSEKRELFLKITQTLQYSFCEITSHRPFVCNNHNEMLRTNKNIISGKTGYTAKAGYCYVAAFEDSDGRKYCLALLACGWPNHKNYKWKDTQKLVDYIHNAYTYSTLQIPDKNVLIRVFNGTQNHYYLLNLNLCIGERKILKKQDEYVSVSYACLLQTNRSIGENSIIGMVKVNIGKVCIGMIPIYLKHNIC